MTRESVDVIEASSASTQKKRPDITNPVVQPNTASVPVGGSPARGMASAPVTVVEFADFQCPGCRETAQSIPADLIRDYGEENVRIVFKYSHSGHQDAKPAARAAYAAGKQGKFWEFHDTLWEKFPNKDDGAQAYEAFIDEENLINYAKELNLDTAAFKRDMSSPEANARVEGDLELGVTLGVSSPPSFFINGRQAQLNGNITYEAVSAMVSEELTRFEQTKTHPNGYYAYTAYANAQPNDGVADTKRMLVPVGDSPVYGDPNAPVTVVEFSDFQCPGCSQDAKMVKDLVDQNKGKVKVVFKHNPLSFHKNAPLAHKASIAAQKQGKFWEYHDLLFANQKALQRPQLIEYAKQLQLDMAKFEKDMDDPAAQNILDRDMAEGVKVSVQGTPHFFMNGTRIKGAQPLEAFQGNLTKEIETVEKYRKEGVKDADLYKTIVEKEQPKPIELDPEPMEP